MTQQQVALIKRSWQIIQTKQPELIGDAFYTKLFVDNPELGHMFPSSRVEQSKKLVMTLGIVVNQLDKLDELSPAIEKLAIRHVEYGVKAEHYKFVGSALIWALEKLLGDEWDEELSGAWITCYEILSHKMMSAAYPTICTNQVV